MSLFPLSPVAQRLAIGAIVLATAGAGISLLTPKNTPEATTAPAHRLAASTSAAASTAEASPPAANALPASAPAASAPHAAALEVTTLTQAAPGKKTPAARQFPFVSSASADVAARINNQLFIDTFEVLAPARASDGLREVSAQMWQSRPVIDFKVQRNDGRIFSVALASEGCGAYCESNTIAHAFDAASGRHLDIADIFTPAGRAALAKEVKAANLAAIQAEISRLKNDKTKGPGGKKHASSEDSATALKMYEDCAQQRQSPDYGSAMETRAMQIQAQTVVFSMERCSNHALQALDELGDFSLRFAPDKLAPWLSAYGRYLLLGEAASFAEPTAPWGQVFHGNMGGKLPVTVYVGAINPDGSVGGHYFYDRHRKPIALFGRFDAGTLTLTETDSQDKLQPRLVLTPLGKELRGRWEGATTLDITLAP